MRVVAAARFQLGGFVRSHRVVPPAIAILMALLLLHASRDQPPLSYYANAAGVLFPLLAWSTKALLDTEPEIQRELTALAVGGARRHAVSGLLASAAFVAGVSTVSLLVPIVFGNTPRVRNTDVLLGALLHLVVCAAAVTIGTVASGWTMRAPLIALGILFTGCLGSFLLGLQRFAVLPLLAPPVVRALRSAYQGDVSFEHALPALIAAGVLWSGVVASLHIWTRRHV